MNFKKVLMGFFISLTLISFIAQAQTVKPVKKGKKAKVQKIVHKKKGKKAKTKALAKDSLKVAKDSTAKDSAKTKETKYQKLFKSFVMKAEGPFISLYKDKDDKIFIGLDKKYNGAKILAGGVVRTVSDPNYIQIGYKYDAPLYLKIQINKDSTVSFLEPNVIASSIDPQMKLAMERNFRDDIYKRYEIKAFSPDSQIVYFDATSMIKDLSPKSSQFSPSSGDSKAHFYNCLKSFKDNASVILTENVDVFFRFMGLKIPLGGGTISSTISFLLLKDSKMTPRIQDSRIGIFPSSSKYNLSTKEDGFEKYRLAKRWDLEPKDTAAWLQGKGSEVKKPIVWYVDNSFPKKWIKPIKEGVLAWNAAFEKIGLKNVMQVRDFPSKAEDSEFDPDNLKYNCIRYIPSTVMNAMGPSWANPLNGEILNASVLVYNDISKLLQNWRFVQTAQVDKRIRSKKLPDAVLEESLRYVLSHEIGHTLGLMHNMGASAAVPVDSLLSATYTHKYGITPSIMDYARFNYVAQPKDTNLQLTPSKLGVYDIYAIDWLYRPVIGAKNMWEESKIASKIIDKHAGDPYYRYGAQQIPMRGDYDPSSKAEDLSNDPMRASALGVKNLKYILKNLNNWVQNDSSRIYRSNLYDQLCKQYYRYLSHTLANVGGLYLNQVKEGTPGIPVQAVNAKRQEKSFKWVLHQLRTMSWLDDPKLSSKFELHTPISNSMAYIMGSSLVSTVPYRIVLAESYGSKYSIGEYYSQLYSSVFHAGHLSSAEMTLQRRILESAKTLLSRNSLLRRSPFGIQDSANMSNIAENREIANLLSPDINCYPDVEEIHDINKPGDNNFGQDKAPYQSAVSIMTINTNNTYLTAMIEKIKNLAHFRSNFSFSAKRRAHYAYIYRQACEILKY